MVARNRPRRSSGAAAMTRRNLPRHRIGQAQIVGGRHPVNQHAHLVAAADGINHAAVIGGGGLTSECVPPGLVAESWLTPARTLTVGREHEVRRAKPRRGKGARKREG